MPDCISKIEGKYLVQCGLQAQLGDRPWRQPLPAASLALTAQTRLIISAWHEEKDAPLQVISKIARKKCHRSRTWCFGMQSLYSRTAYSKRGSEARLPWFLLALSQPRFSAVPMIGG